MHKSNLGIAHTRWATHGAKTDQNAHPHSDHKSRIALVHNGIIENYQLLKDELVNNHGISPKSETDSEVIALLIGHFLDQDNSIVDAIKKTCLKLIGSYNIALIYIADPKAIYAVRNSGELSIAKDLVKGHSFLCSDSDVLKDEFSLDSHGSEFTKLAENVIVRVSSSSIEQYPI
jgi:glutamine---fructose-6-phosphate transaminase (isomerizing)